MNEHQVFDFLSSHHIEHKVFRHQPVFTTNDIPVLIDSGDVTKLPGLIFKTLFLKDKKANALYLVSVSEEKRVDMKALSEQLGTGRFSFGSSDELMQYLKLTPGSVNPFALLVDTEKKVTFILDEDATKASFVNFHPMRNDMNITLTPKAFLECMEKMDHFPRITRIPVQTEARSV